MPIGMGIHIEIKGWPAASRQQLAEVAQDGMAAAAQYWHRQDLPDHFLPTAVSKYGYKPRARSYMLRKAKRKGHQNPLSYTGELRGEMMRSAEIRRHKTGVDLKMRGRALNFSGKAVKREAGVKMYGGGTYPNLKGEVTAITKSEDVELARVARKVSAKSMQAIRATKRKAL
jgi:hypothetical protein